MKRVDCPSCSVYVIHARVEHAGGEWRRKYRVQYHSFMISENHDLSFVKSLASEESISLGAKKAALYFQRDLGMPKRDSGWDAVLRDFSINEWNTENSKSNFAAFQLRGSVCSIRRPEHKIKK